MEKHMKRLIKALLRDFNPMWMQSCIHCYVSTLPPMGMGGYQVTGIHGVDIPQFWGSTSITPSYPGLLDEARVGIHQFLSTPYVPSYQARYIHYCLYLHRQGINPLVVTYHHWKSL